MMNFHLLKYSFAGQDSAIYLNLDCVKSLYVYPRQNDDQPENIVIQWIDGGNTTYETTREQLKSLLSAIDY